MTRDLYKLTGFAVELSPAFSIALELTNKATGQAYVVSKTLPRGEIKLKIFLAFVGVGSDAVKLCRAENVPGWEWELAESKVDVRWPVHVVRKIACPCCGNDSTHDFWVGDREAKNDSAGGRLS